MYLSEVVVDIMAEVNWVLSLQLEVGVQMLD